MSRTAQGWQHPGKPESAQERAFRQRYIVSFTVDNRTFTCHREVAPIFKALVEELVNVYRYSIDEVMDDWGWANRSVRGSYATSNHAYGLAIDLNATVNGLTYRNPPPNDLPENVSGIARKYGLRWGGDYNGRKDPMHFEFMGSVDEAREIVRKLSGSGVPPTTPTEDEMIEYLYRDPRDGREWLCTGFTFKRYVDDPAELGFLQQKRMYDQSIPSQVFDSMRDVTPGRV